MVNTDTSLIQEELLARIDEKMKQLNSMRPIPADALSRLHEEMRLVHTYHSNAIEGNTLTLQETKLVLEEGLTIGGKSLREHLEATNNAKAFDRMEELAKKKRAIDNIAIQEIHEIVTRSILEDAGRYRTRNVRIAGAVKAPPDWSKIVKLMDELIEKVAESKVHPIETASFLHHRFVEIHPFSDGNERVARLLTNLYLISRDCPPVVLKKEDREKYYKFLRAADAGNLGPFANFIAKAVDENLTLYLSISGGKDELMPLKELATETPYSQEYLSLRARQGLLDAVKIGKTWHSSKRAVEQYLSEHGKKDV
ncbi:Huntingtin interacting protein E-like protein [Methanosarcina siciliae T4/M]|uniref:Huntingtin interacting protein E-like protein n=1 Tax=Methanosarcina siciliae T4/M TaxID=1434120 RepID=A0A0E3L8S9_9EURY|nr:Fic family protein [Methanosarcina siciliae]AKB29051.1 Huntingtin interacting protein E-like protein [Methanosarcina siciliae T4/M]